MTAVGAKQMRYDPICSVPECRRPHWTHGYCARHFQRMRQYGQLERTRDHVYSAYHRFWKHLLIGDVSRDEDCWEWQGTRLKGYGVMWVTQDGRCTTVRAHRYAYELIVGPIPEGLTIDHLCRNRACCNPTHLEPVTIAENVRRGLTGRRKVICKRGHEIDYSGGRGICRECRNAAAREKRQFAGVRPKAHRNNRLETEQSD